MKHSVALIIGHSQDDQGARNKTSNISEFMFNSYLAEIIQHELKSKGYIVHTIHRDSGYGDLPRKVNETKVDIAISLHCNAFNNIAHGSEVLYYNGSENGRHLAGFIQEYVVFTLGTENRGLKPCEYDYVGKTGDKGGYLLKYTSMPCVIVEPFFIDCDESLHLAQCKFRELAHAYVCGVRDYFLYVGV